jgi:hypothetical protein
VGQPNASRISGWASSRELNWGARGSGQLGVAVGVGVPGVGVSVSVGVLVGVAVLVGVGVGVPSALGGGRLKPNKHPRLIASSA